ncbi:MAG: hypothetical protein L0J17_16025, partial [Brevibacterium sp.]|nr:hypothetical protein [Brevibacterium sp.]
TTDKILANAITAGKIAALAIEADHISANAITADKINAGAIDGKLITGARIRTSASGRRTELDVEGLKSYDSSGNTVLTTQTSDGSISMKGALRQTSKGITIEVGNNYQGGGPGIQWQDSSIYNYPPGVIYSEDTAEPGKMRTLIQGPGVTDGNSFLSLNERGDRFDLRAWKGTGSSRTDWRVDADVGGMFRVGSSMTGAPRLYMRRGATGKGYARLRYEHPSLDGAHAMLSLEMNEIYLASYTEHDNLVGRLWMDNKSSELSAGSKNLYLRGKDVFLSPTADISLNAGSGKIYTPGIPESVGKYATLVRDNGVISWLNSSRRYKIAEEPIEYTVESFEDKLLSVDAKTWIPKRPAEQYADYLTALGAGEDPACSLDEISTIERMPGVIAEEMHEAGLGIFVVYDEDGKPNSVMYEGIATSLIPIIRRLRDRVDALETKLGETA